MHGYVLQSVINAALGPFRRLSWGTLYPLLRRLEQEGLIKILRGESSDSRGTKSYRTTSRGRTRFLELMRSPANRDSDYRDLFRIKLSNFGHIGKADRHSILQEYRAFLAEMLEHSDAMSGAVTEAPGMAAAERPYVLKAIDHQRHLAASEIAWLDALIQIRGGHHASSIQNEKGIVYRSRGNGSSRTGIRSRRVPGE